MQRDLERAKREGADLAGAARERGREQLQEAKSHVAERAERIADAVEATADELESSGDGMVSGYGRSLASMMRQMAGGLRERDIDEFASELTAFARRNPGAFLAGSVALGFGLSRFLKAGSSKSASPADEDFDEVEDEDFIAEQGFAAADEDLSAGTRDYGAGEDMAAFKSASADADDPASDALGTLSDPSRPPTDRRGDLSRGDSP